MCGNQCCFGDLNSLKVAGKQKIADGKKYLKIAQEIEKHAQACKKAEAKGDPLPKF